MKKLLVLTLVLGLASAANAVIIEVDGQRQEAVVDPDTSVVVTIIGEDTANILAYVIVDEGGLGALSGVEVLAGAGNQAGAEAYTEAGWGAGYNITVASTSVPTNVAIGPQFTLNYSYSGDIAANPTTISLYIDPEYVAPAAQISIVPEPMTVLLLGLGGLFLRRRK